MFIDPPVTKQKSQRTVKPDGTRTLTHEIHHDPASTLQMLRHAHPKGGRGEQGGASKNPNPPRTRYSGAKEEMHRERRRLRAGNYDEAVFIPPHDFGNIAEKMRKVKSNTAGPGHDFASGKLDTSQVQDRRFFDPTANVYGPYNAFSGRGELERPAPVHRNIDPLELEQGLAGSLGPEDVAQGDPTLERPAPRFRHRTSMEMNPDLAGSQLPFDVGSGDYEYRDIPEYTPEQLFAAARGEDHYINRLRGSARARRAKYRGVK